MLLRDFRLYMLVGGMPQAVDAYITTNNMSMVDQIKRNILELYEDDFRKIDPTGRAGMLFDAIPAELNKNASRYQVSSVIAGEKEERIREIFADMQDSMTVYISYHANNPNAGMAFHKDLSFRSMLESNGASELHPIAGDTFTLGSAEIQVVSPADYVYEDENDNSIAMRIVYGDFSCILTGDAGTEAEADMIASGYTLDSDLYVVGHHGSSSSSSEDFVNAVSPDYAVISVGAGNSYGHPTEETLFVLESCGVELYRTDVQGEIICCTDGTDCRFNVDSTDNWLAGSELSSSDTVYFSAASAGENSEPQEYVLNTNTMKFHYPDCSSVSQMNDANKEVVTESRDILIQEGYDPCGRCHP